MEPHQQILKAAVERTVLHVQRHAHEIRELWSPQKVTEQVLREIAELVHCTDGCLSLIDTTLSIVSMSGKAEFLEELEELADGARLSIAGIMPLLHEWRACCAGAAAARRETPN
jgi:hypothetical protein